MLDDIRRAGCRRIVVIGDIINGVDPVGCVDLLAGHPAAVCLSGNAEWYLATPDLHAFPLEQFRWLDEVIALVEWWRARLDAAQRDWLAGLPHMLVEQDCCFVHDS
ncbi:MAG TPA: hypothetical protein VFT99_08450, partial [Roseiflexaceae bacterium]|nr:hypothetical protein [Roseiflexaceae bacterium]